MDILTMTAMGLFDDDEKKGRRAMTDKQFKAFIKMCQVLAKSTNEVKTYVKWMKGVNCPTTEGAHRAFGILLVQIAEATGSVESVRQTLQEALEDLRIVG